MAFFNFEQCIIDPERPPWGVAGLKKRILPPDDENYGDDGYYGGDGDITDVWIEIPVNDPYNQHLDWYWYDPWTCRLADQSSADIMGNLEKIQIFFDGTRALEFDLRFYFVDDTFIEIPLITGLDADHSILIDFSEYINFEEKTIKNVYLYNIVNGATSYFPEQVIGVYQ